MSVLQRIVTRRRADLAAGVALPAWAQADAKACKVQQPGRLEQALQASGDSPRLMLEIKPSAPSSGPLNTTQDWAARVALYEGVAMALSVLTEPHHFGGSYDLLRQVARASARPVLCKDFIVDARQIHAARLAGAEAVLLIVKALDDDALTALSASCRALGMTPLIEIQNEAEWHRAFACCPWLGEGVGVVLINNRNLDTLAIDMTTTERLSKCLPPGVLRMSASGIDTRAALDALRPACHGALIGSALMRLPLEALPAALAALCTPEPFSPKGAVSS